MKEFRLPDPGEGLVEAEIVNWLVAVGDEVKVNDVVVEVETSKSLVELPIPFAGRVAEILAAEGDLVDVGRPIIIIDDGSGEGVSNGSEDAEDKPTPNLVGYGAKTGSSSRRARKQAAPSEAAAGETHDQMAQVFEQSVPVSRRYDEHTPIPPLDAQPHGDPLPGPGQQPAAAAPVAGVLAKPPVRKLAKDLGVDLTTVSGSGDGGIITREDVEQAAQSDPRAGRGPAPASAARPVTTAEDQRIPVKGVRKITAEAMVASAFSAPHVTEWVTCDVTGTMDFVESLRKHPDFAGIRVSPTLWFARATLLALRRNPSLNSSWDGDAGEIVQHRRVNLGLAAATPRGLMVPNVKDAGSLGLRDLALALNELVEVAKAGRTQPRDTSGGTFTITNVGVFGVDSGTPIINPGEGAILCMGAIDRRPWVVGQGAAERIEPRWVTTVAVSFDHRMIDGEQGSEFLADVARYLKDPALAMLD